MPLTVRLTLGSKMATEIAFKPYKPLRSEGNHLEDRIERIREMIKNKLYLKAIEASEELMTMTLAGFRYLQTYSSQSGLINSSYDWLFLRSLVTAGFLGWTLFVLVHVFDSYVLPRRLSPHRGQIETILTAVVAIGLATVLFIQHCPLIYYAYAGFPVFFWEEILANRETLKEGLKVLMEGDGKRISSVNITAQSLLYVGILESLVSPCEIVVVDVRCMDIFTDRCLVFVLFLRRCGLLPMARSFGGVILNWLRVGRFVA